MSADVSFSSQSQSSSLIAETVNLFEATGVTKKGELFSAQKCCISLRKMIHEYSTVFIQFVHSQSCYQNSINVTDLTSKTLFHRCEGHDFSASTCP